MGAAECCLPFIGGRALLGMSCGISAIVGSLACVSPVCVD